MIGIYKYSLTFFLFVGNLLITEYNPDVKTLCDWFARNIYYVPNRGKNVRHYYKIKFFTQELTDIC